MLQVYGETSVGKESGCNEMSTLEPTNPYSAAKAGAGQQAPLCTYSFRVAGAIRLGQAQCLEADSFAVLPVLPSWHALPANDLRPYAGMIMRACMSTYFKL